MFITNYLVSKYNQETHLIVQLVQSYNTDFDDFN